MLVQILELLGTSERALYIARALTFLVMWLEPFEFRRLISHMNRAIEAAKRLRRAA